MSLDELTREQRMAVEHEGGRLLVSAAAGSGKTKVLVERLMRKLAQGADIRDFLIITYTNAAAAELRGKILDAIFDRIAQDPGNLKLRADAAAAGRARIGTIHSFCASVIRENAHKLRLPPDFRVADEQEADVLKSQALSELLDSLFESGDADFLTLADTLGAGRDDRQLCRVILDTHVKLMSHPSPEKWVAAQLAATDQKGVTDLARTPWGRVIMDRARDAAAYWAEQMEYLCDEAAWDPTLAKGYGRSFEATLSSLRAFIRALDGTWDEARAASDIAFPPGRVSGYDAQKAVRTDCREAMKKITALFWDDSERALGDMRRVAPSIRALYAAVLEFDRRYGELKRRRGVLDFADQEHFALRLLTREDTGEPTDTALELAGGITEIMVDEYQDVNRIQEAIFNAVSRGGRNIFTVGDVKQSIYRFRLADPSIFLKQYLTFADAEKAAPGEPARVVLSKNFRSRQTVLQAVNFIFKNVMSAGLGELDYTPREYLVPGSEAQLGGESRVELDVIDMSGWADEETDGEEGEPAGDKAAAEAMFAAGRIRELVDHGTLPDGNGGERAVTYGDIAVLMRSPRAVLPQWQAAFAQRGIPLAAAQPTDFFAEHEVSLVLAMLEVIDNPRQDIPLISVLRSPVFGFTGEELAGIRLYDRKGDFWQALSAAAAENGKCAAFLEKLAALRAAAPDMTSVELLWTLCSQTRLFAVVSAMPDGERRRENLMLLMELAGSYEAAGYRGLFGFLQCVRALRESGKGPETVGRGGDNAVTLMSVHKSKGLEFPIVILAGLTRRFNTEDTRARLLIHPQLGAGPKLTDTQRGIEYYTAARRAVAIKLSREMLSEELRVLYVAMTRPREKLILITSHANAERELSKLMNVSLPAHPEYLAGRGNMGEWILAPALRRPESGAIRFGAPNVPCDTDGDVWDVRLVTSLAAAQTSAPREEESAPAPAPELPDDVREALGYVYPHAAATLLPSKITATELKGTFPTREAAEEAVSMDDALGALRPRPAPERPAFMEGRSGLTAAQRGTAAHMVMQYADYEKCVTREGAAEEIRRLALMGILTREQADAVRPGMISGFFATDTGKLLLGAKKLRRELKFSLLADSGRIPGREPGEKVLLQGVVDCCVEEDGALTVIDFKTDAVTADTIAARAEYYRGQIDTYAYAMERVLKKPVRRRILCFLTTGRSVEL